ncbi:septation protein SepH [Plantactinospora solaniradicis]|uniref:Septation protein SepH n=1 Tax=Plantactinospora solaniradicis TaxID=1723736 RepID=A0ABW1KDV7_9ACTN
MRPVRFVALSEDGQAMVLTDEVGRLLALPIDERVATVLHTEPGSAPLATASPGTEPAPSLSPRDIQARIRSGESAEDVARIAGVPVDRVLRYAGPVLQERAMLAQHARRTRLRNAENKTPLAEIVDGRLSQHGIDTEKISWDAYRRDDGTWRIVATWPSGKATAQAIWDLDKARQSVTPHDDMAQYLCAERPAPLLGQEPAPERSGRSLPGPSRVEPSRGGHGLPAAAGEHARPGRDPIRAGRDALLASLDRPLGSTAGRGLDPAASMASPDTPRQRPVAGGAAALLGGGPGSAFDDDADAPKEVPAVPSLAVLRPRRTTAPAAESADPSGKPRKRLPSWDDVLFGSGPAARDGS